MEWIVGLIVFIIVASVVVGLNLKSSRKHRARREEIIALKTSGAFEQRKSNMD
jgi:hypothetical protein